MLRNIEAIKKDRRDEARGWGKTRKERERKKEEKRSSNQLDERLVLNDEGNVCIAEDYDGDIEAAMARYDKALGYGTPRPRRAVANEVIPPVVPDFARWVPSAVEPETSRENGNVSSEAIADGAEESFGHGNGGDRESRQAEECVPLMPDAEGEQANRQNEVGEAGGAIEDRAADTRYQADGGTRDSRPNRGRRAANA